MQIVSNGKNKKNINLLSVEISPESGIQGSGKPEK